MNHYVRVIPNSDHPNRYYEEWFHTKEEALAYWQYMKQLTNFEMKVGKVE